jgi:hypothetical protein
MHSHFVLPSLSADANTAAARTSARHGFKNSSYACGCEPRNKWRTLPGSPRLPTSSGVRRAQWNQRASSATRRAGCADLPKKLGRRRSLASPPQATQRRLEGSRLTIGNVGSLFDYGRRAEPRAMLPPTGHCSTARARCPRPQSLGMTFRHAQSN